ncbi:MAG: efflux transporter, family, subunit [Flavipsychrobacter sp.]|jgi:RND family efflux transporter MFP subunit|nr:efflux transporter, family, subunit [Flavipsychrobacter sp.]
MKQLIYLLIPAMVFASCGGGTKDPAAELADLKKQRAEIDVKIKTMEASSGKSDTTAGKVTAVSVADLQPTVFNAFIEVQSQITGDQVVNATARTMGTVNRIYVQVGQAVRQGQVLATLDASVAEQQIKALEPQIELAKSLYEKQQKLWEQNIGTEVQLMSAKTQYDNLLKQKDVMKAGKDLYNIVSPINGIVDAVNMKVGDAGMMTSIRVVNTNTLKAEASLGENYLGKVKTGDIAILIFPDTNDTLKTKVSYVSKAVDPLSRTFSVQVKLAGNNKLHPNMSCILKIANYENRKALVIPISVIQKTSQGEMVYVAEGNNAKSVMITTGRNANGMVEVTSGLKAGDKVITAGFEDLDNGEPISVQ